MIVYSLACTCHPAEGTRYVGQTVRTGPRRLAEHRRDATSGRSGAIVYRWMRRHGVENIELTVLETLPEGATKEDLDAAEGYWMVLKRAANPFLLNMWSPRPTATV